MLAAVLVGAWLVVIFGRALADANAQTARLAQEQSVNVQLRARVEAGRREISLTQTAPFLDFEARLFGLGKASEKPFALAAGAPPPPPLRRLGSESPFPSNPSPLDDWLRLLFGSTASRAG
jgi:cell division protein FtsB